MGLLIPDANQSVSLVKKYLPGSLIVGASAAGLQHLATMLHEMKKDEKADLERKDVLTVPIPASTAKVASGRASLLQRAIGLGVVSPEAAQKAIQASQAAAAPAMTAAQRMANFRARMGLPAAPPPAAPAAPPASPPPPPVSPPAAGAASAPPPAPAPSTAPAASSAAKPSKVVDWVKQHPVAASAIGSVAAATGGSMAYNSATGEQPPSLMDAGIIAGTIPLGVIGGYSLINHFIRQRKKKNLEEQLAAAKGEYSNLLGASLAGKTASLDVSEFPFIEGACLGLLEAKSGEQKVATNAGLLLAGTPLAAAAISSILAHRWMYGKQQEIENMVSSERPKPPKQIRLVSAPAPQSSDESEDEKPLSIGLQSEKVAEVPVTLADKVLSFIDGSAPASAEEALQRQLEKERDQQIEQPKAVKVGPGVVQIASKDGPVEIQAEDPAAAKILAAKTPKLTKLIGAFQSTDPTLR
jgi:hypothetical protein